MRKSQTTKKAPRRDSYLELVQRVPLKTIKNDDAHARATRMISELMGRQLDPGAGDYLDTLLVLVNDYEEKHHAINETLTPQEALRALMEFNDLSQADIGRIIGSESAVSMFFKGERDLSKSQIKKLAARFKLDASVFLT
jgi:HTH-type transcriptional regulator/antitoxin HigA